MALQSFQFFKCTTASRQTTHFHLVHAKPGWVEGDKTTSPRKFRLNYCFLESCPTFAMPPKLSCLLANDWLKQNSTSAGQLLQQVQQLKKLQNDINTWSAGGPLKLHVSTQREKRLKLFVDHPAILARARQQLPSLLSRLNERGWGLVGIDLKLRSYPEPLNRKTHAKQGRFSNSAKKAFLKLSQELHHPDLQAATVSLCQHNDWTLPTKAGSR
jgi:hypothetical protein